jgi:HAD superfamily hydrolase (TIGR01450 family)
MRINIYSLGLLIEALKFSPTKGLSTVRSRRTRVEVNTMFGKRFSSTETCSRSAISGLSEIIHMYDHFIIDQWGVLHNGKVPYPGVMECLQKLKEANKQLILLSNSSKRKASSFAGLNKVGISAALFDDIVTSGEMAWHMIEKRTFPFQLAGLPASEPDSFPKDLNVFVIGNADDDLKYVKTAGCQPSLPETAHFVLARGTFCIMSGSEGANIITYKNAADLVAATRPWLERCIARDLPMLVSNPDFHRPGSGAPMPGQIGRLYSELGGRVEYIGKPHSAVYAACLDVIQRSRPTSQSTSSSLSPLQPSASAAVAVDVSRVCGVGDSLDHDILGAERAGFASVWTANGVHCDELGTAEGAPELPAEELLEGMYARYGVRPTHTTAAFRW